MWKYISDLKEQKITAEVDFCFCVETSAGSLNNKDEDLKNDIKAPHLKIIHTILSALK